MNFHQKANGVLTESPQPGELVLFLILKYQKGAVFLLESLRMDTIPLAFPATVSHYMRWMLRFWPFGKQPFLDLYAMDLS